MTRGRLLLVMGVGLAVLVAVGAVRWAVRPRPGISEANCACIRAGMRQKEVEALMGGPPSLYAAVDPASGKFLGRTTPFPAGTCCRGAWWSSEEGAVMVRFGDDGTVVDAAFARKGNPTLFERLRRLLP